MSAYITIETRDALNRIRKKVPSRERIEDLRRLGLYIGTLGDDDAETDSALLLEVAELLLDLRQTLRGGRREPSGSRYWPETSEPETQ